MFIGSTTYNFNNKSKDLPNAISIDNIFYYVNSHGVNKTCTFTTQLTAASLKAQHYVKKGLHNTKHSTINKQISKKCFPSIKIWHSPSFFRFFCTLSGRLLSRNTLVFGRFNSKERANVHRTPFLFTSLIPHCLKSQLSKYCGKKALLGVEKSLEVTFFVFLGVGTVLKICLTSSYTPIWLCPRLFLELLLYQCMPLYLYT